MLGPHTTYNVNYFPRCVLVFCISKDSPAMLPINYVHLLPAIYYICSPCAAAILRNNCFDWILEEFSWWVLLVASLDNFLLSAEIVRASLLECIGRCASLHIWCRVNVVWFDFFLQNQLRIENKEHHCWHALNVLPFCIFYITNSPNTKVNTVWVFSTAAHCCSLKK